MFLHLSTYSCQATHRSNWVLSVCQAHQAIAGEGGELRMCTLHLAAIHCIQSPHQHSGFLVVAAQKFLLRLGLQC